MPLKEMCQRCRVFHELPGEGYCSTCLIKTLKEERDEARKAAEPRQGFFHRVFGCPACATWKRASDEALKACQNWRELWDQRGGWEEMLRPGRVLFDELDRLRKERDEARQLSRMLLEELTNSYYGGKSVGLRTRREVETLHPWIADDRT